MKPTEPDIAWCIEHREFVNGLLEKRGWHKGDWVWLPTFGVNQCAVDGGQYSDTATWLPSVGDVLGMLEEICLPMLLSTFHLEKGVIWEATDGAVTRSGWQNTPLIALLELLREVKG